MTVHSNRRKPLLMEFALKPGRVTIARLSQSGGAWRLVLGGGEMLQAPQSFSGTAGVARFDLPASTVLDRIVCEGLEHHYSLAYGDHRPGTARLGGGLEHPGPGTVLDPIAPDWSCLDPATDLSQSTAIPGGLRWTTSLGPLEATAYAPGIFRLRFPRDGQPDYGLLVEPPDNADTVVQSTPDAGASISLAGATLRITDGPLRISLDVAGSPILSPASDGHFVRALRLPPFARTANGWMAAWSLASDQAVYGLGEKWGRLDRRGQLVVSRAEDALGVNAELSYKNVPFAWSPEGWGILVHTPATVRHGVGTPTGRAAPTSSMSMTPRSIFS